ncbi:MAG TPA: Xaa-Pro peptidase family protein [Symbiobacteriaceae bacterium]|nr:Xaa-Pro peptidase family protein [Symbiobacteriaceae bacterium]
MITQQKLDQAVALLPQFGLDCWLLLGRETGELCDPSLPLILETTVTWQSAFLVDRGGERIAIVGRYDVHNVEASGGWTRVIGYDEDLGAPLRAELERLAPQSIGLNYSQDNHTSDGLTFGMYLSLLDWLKGTPYAGRLVSADLFASAVRARKTEGELARIRAAVEATVAIFDDVPGVLKPGMTEQELQAALHQRVDGLKAATSWEREYCPIVNFGPDSSVGHAGPSAIGLEPGHVVHLDFGVKLNGYCADLQRCWYVAPAGQTAVPAEVQRAFETVKGAILAAAAFLRPGVTGAAADEVARRFVTDAGYPEFKHALGHQVGRTCHDGATLLGPRWPRYGSTVEQPVQEGEVYTLELGVMTGAGIVSLEEMVVVTATGCRFLSDPQSELLVVTDF